MAVAAQEGGQDANPAKRRLPIQVANEAKMIAGTIELLYVHDVGDIRNQSGQLSERVARAHHRRHLYPVAEQHDRDEGR